MRTRQHLRRIRVQRAVVDIKAEVDDARKGHILRLGADLQNTRQLDSFPLS